MRFFVTLLFAFVYVAADEDGLIVPESADDTPRNSLVEAVWSTVDPCAKVLKYSSKEEKKLYRTCESKYFKSACDTLKAERLSVEQEYLASARKVSEFDMAIRLEQCPAAVKPVQKKIRDSYKKRYAILRQSDAEIKMQTWRLARVDSAQHACGWRSSSHGCKGHHRCFRYSKTELVKMRKDLVASKKKQEQALRPIDIELKKLFDERKKKEKIALEDGTGSPSGRGKYSTEFIKKREEVQKEKAEMEKALSKSDMLARRHRQYIEDKANKEVHDLQVKIASIRARKKNELHKVNTASYEQAWRIRKEHKRQGPLVKFRELEQKRKKWRILNSASGKLTKINAIDKNINPKALSRGWQKLQKQYADKEASKQKTRRRGWRL